MKKKNAIGNKLMLTLTLATVGLFFLNSTLDNDFTNPKSEKDVRFMAAAAEMSLVEVELGTLAAHNAVDADVRILGETMVIAHSKFYNELQNMAARKGIYVPSAASAPSRPEALVLGTRRGKDLDQEYCRIVISNHIAAIETFEKASEQCDDPEIKEWAASTLTQLNHHCAMAEECQQKATLIVVKSVQ